MAGDPRYANSSIQGPDFFWESDRYTGLNRPNSNINFTNDSLFTFGNEDYYQPNTDQEQNDLSQQFSNSMMLNEDSKQKKSRALKVNWPDEPQKAQNTSNFNLNGQNGKTETKSSSTLFFPPPKTSKSLPSSRRASVTKDDFPDYLNSQDGPYSNQTNNPSLLSVLINQNQNLQSSQSSTNSFPTQNKLDEKSPFYGKPFPDYHLNKEPFGFSPGQMSPSIPPQFDDNFLNDDEMEANMGSPIAPSHVKKYLQKIATDRTQFPILLRRDSTPGMLSVSSAALDLAALPQTNRSYSNFSQDPYHHSSPLRQEQTQEYQSHLNDLKTEKIDMINGKSDDSLNSSPRFENGGESWESNDSGKGGYCKYYRQGFCSRGDRCKFPHIPESQIENQSPDTSSSPPYPISQNTQNSIKLNSHSPDSLLPESPPQENQKNSKQGTPKKGHKRSTSAPEAPRFPPLEQLVGQIYSLCRDQHGCRYLQKKLEEGKEEHIEIIFNEIYEHLLELMSDPFGNYLCQKLFVHTTEAQRTKIAQSVGNVDSTSKDRDRDRDRGLVDVSMNMHGTRSVQKLIDCMQTDEQIELIIKALKGNVVKLIKDLNGNHVIQKCLNKLPPEQNQFIYDAVSANCVEVASHRHGCCVLQRCIDHASDAQKLQLSREVTKNALTLVQDAFGNYVVQYILDLNVAALSIPLIRQFLGHVYHLSLQKFSSNVIEKCIRVADLDTRRGLVSGVLDKDKLPVMLQDAYANYVVQTSLDVADYDQQILLADLVRPLLPAIRHLPYCKRVQSKLSRDYRLYQGNYIQQNAFAQ